MRAPTLIIALIILLGIIYLGWQMINSNLAGKARTNTTDKKRRSDRLKLTRAEKRAYRHAQKLYQEGNFRACAKILESLGMLRGAIDVLEKAGLIREAADALIRIQRPNRAGVVSARHGIWKEAMECFKKASMPLEVAKCARELGDLATAIPYFLEAGAALDAAECHLELGRHHEAAKLFLRHKELDKALEQYVNLVDSHPDIERIDFTEDEINFVTKNIIDARVDVKLADILIAKNRSVKLIAELIKAGNLKTASAVYLRGTSDIGPKLIQYSDFNRDDNLLLGALFCNAGAYEYGGMVFERLEEFERAGDSFEKGELFERAAFCFERALNKQRATDMRIMAASRGGSQLNRPSQSPAGAPPVPPPSSKNAQLNPFSIRDTTTDFPEHLRPSNNSGIPNATDAYLNQNAPAATMSASRAEEKGGSANVNWENFYQAEFMLDLTTQEQDALRAICKTKDYPKGSIILDYNQEPLGIYFVLSGSLAIMKTDDEGRETALDMLQTSDTFGELWLLMDQPTKLKFVSRSACTLGWIKRADFEQLTDKNGAIARKLYKRYAIKLVSKLMMDANPSKNRNVS